MDAKVAELSVCVMEMFIEVDIIYINSGSSATKRASELSITKRHPCYGIVSPIACIFRGVQTEE